MTYKSECVNFSEMENTVGTVINEKKNTANFNARRALILY